MKRAALVVALGAALAACGGGTRTVTEPASTGCAVWSCGGGSSAPSVTPATVTCGWYVQHRESLPDDATNEQAASTCFGAFDDSSKLVTVDVSS